MTRRNTMKEGEHFTIVLTIKGTLTKDLKEVLQVNYPDDSFVEAIQKLITEEFSTGELSKVSEEATVSFTNVDHQSSITE
jgi:hypothetical protein